MPENVPFTHCLRETSLGNQIFGWGTLTTSILGRPTETTRFWVPSLPGQRGPKRPVIEDVWTLRTSAIESEGLFRWFNGLLSPFSGTPSQADSLQCCPLCLSPALPRNNQLWPYKIWVEQPCWQRCENMRVE